MLTKLSTNIFYRILGFGLVILFLPNLISAQVLDSIKVDSIPPDSTTQTIKQKKSKKKDFILESKIIRNAKDSVIVDYTHQKAYLYGEAKVEYDNITLEAPYIEIDFEKNTVYATGLPDSNGVIQGMAVFKEGSDDYETKKLTYNFTTRKGLVSNVTKQEGDAYIFISKGKKMPDNTTYVQYGHFTTCSLPHPHYSIRYKKGKIIPDDKIVTGPIYMEIEDIPLPLVLPFGFFPNKKGRANGILIPSYGYTENRGYYLSNGGYYMGLGEHMDLALRGDIYSRGSYAIRAISNYNFRYKSQGSFNFNFAHNKMGETDAENYTEDQSFRVQWSHRQDPKANPNSNFSANVTIGSSQYNKQNSTNTNDYLTNTLQSSIAYSTRIKQSSLNINFNHSQNTKTHVMNLDLPTISFSTQRVSPFQRKNPIGPKKWYEKINFTYRMDAKNQLVTTDTMLLSTQFTDFKNGIIHKIPISMTTPVGHLNWTNSININEYWYFKTVSKYYDPNVIINGVDTGGVVTDDILGFKAGHDVSFSSNLSTRIYGMYSYKWGPMTALRHVMTPTVGFSYHPDMDKTFGYFHEYTDENGNIVRYSIFDGGIFNGPGSGKSGAVTFNLGNTLEAKIKSKNDTITGTKKIKILESFNISTSYDLAKTEFQLAPLTITARTTIFKKIGLQFNSTWDFYAVDSTGTRINKFNFEMNKKLLRKNSSTWNFSANYALSANDFNGEKKTKYESKMGSKAELNQVNAYPERYVDFNNPWSLNLSLSLVYTDAFRPSTNTYSKDTIFTVNFNGDINITQKWKIGITSGYDFMHKDISYTSIDIYRDLHCWELMFNWIPIGPRQSYNLTIRVKSPLLQDLKINKKQDWRDY